jgi:hypothetical protein
MEEEGRTRRQRADRAKERGRSACGVEPASEAAA